MADLDKPLDDKVLTDIDERLTASRKAEELLAKMKRVGFDTDEQNKKLQEQTTLLRNVKTQFFPGRQ